MPIPSYIGGDAGVYVFPQGQTANDIINRAAVENGLGTSANPYASTDPNFILLRYLLQSLGQELWRERNWSHLSREHAFETVTDQNAYPLPPDFGRLIDQTSWNQTTGQPLGGPMTPQQWQRQVSSLAGNTFLVYFRPWKGQIFLSGNSIAGGETIQFEYISRYWVQPAASEVATSSTPTASDDILWFDSELLVYGLKLAWMGNKGFDTTNTQQRFDRMLQQSMGNDSSAPVISLGGRVANLEFNLPDTGWGQ